MNVTKIIVSRCQIFHLKCTASNFRASPQTVLGLLSRPQRSPDILAGFVERERKEGREERGKMEGKWVQGYSAQ